jgi:hypothetical protein
MGQFIISIIVMVAVIGSLAGWAFRTERRRHTETSEEG